VKILNQMTVPWAIVAAAVIVALGGCEPVGPRTMQRSTAGSRASEMLDSYGKCITAGIDKWALTPESADVLTKAILADCRLIAQAYEANRVVEFFGVGSFRGEAAKRDV
jgi:hypothetical protein